MNVLVYCHHRAANVRRSPLQETIPLHANHILFTLSAAPAPRGVIRKTLPPCRRGKDPPLCTLSSSESTVEQTSCFCTPVCTMLCRQLQACSTQAPATCYPLSRESLPVSMLHEITFVNLVWNPMI